MMRSLKCRMCDYKSVEETDEEVMNNMWEHMQEAHKEDTDKMMQMPKEEQDKMTFEARKMIKDEEEEA